MELAPIIYPGGVMADSRNCSVFAIMAKPLKCAAVILCAFVMGSSASVRARRHHYAPAPAAVGFGGCADLMVISAGLG